MPVFCVTDDNSDIISASSWTRFDFLIFLFSPSAGNEVSDHRCGVVEVCRDCHNNFVRQERRVESQDIIRHFGDGTHSQCLGC